jgi:hypothetical protein
MNTTPIRLDPERMLEIVDLFDTDPVAYWRELRAYRRELQPALRARREALRALGVGVPYPTTKAGADV